jgi:hypothetical protein
MPVFFIDNGSGGRGAGRLPGNRCGVSSRRGKSRMDEGRKQFPKGMTPLGKTKFHFRCGPGLKCYMACCRKLDLILYPYDIIRLKKRLSISSEEFMRNHTRLGASSHPFFPAVMLR